MVDLVLGIAGVLVALATLAYAAGYIGPREPDLTQIAIDRDKALVDRIRAEVEESKSN